MKKLTCKRCEHAWYPRSEKIPITCPHCRSPYWNKERRGNGIIDTKTLKAYMKNHILPEKPDSPNNGESLNLLWRLCCGSNIDYDRLYKKLREYHVHCDADILENDLPEKIYI
jgi:hypothetical protein